MIIKSISAENFGKFDRYTVNLDDSINVFYGDNEAGKTTLYEIISILLFAPATEQEIAASNKLIKSDEKYARVYAIINLDGKEISIAREIYTNNTNLSIADQDNVSSLGNVNVPFIGDLTKDMYESFHTIDYYNMATITNNVWQQIVKVIEDSRGAARITPDYSSPAEEEAIKKKSSFEDQIEEKKAKKAALQKQLKAAQKKQKKLINNQDKIDDLINTLEDVENNVELESSYLKEANKMNQIRKTIKKTQNLTIELEKYKDLSPWMPDVRSYYERLKLYVENKANGIENPLDMFDDLKEKAAANEKTSADEIAEKELSPEDIMNDLGIELDTNLDAASLPTEEEFNLAKEKLGKFIKKSYSTKDTAANEPPETKEEIVVPEAQQEQAKQVPREKLVSDTAQPEEDKKPAERKKLDLENLPEGVKPLKIRKPKDMRTKETDEDTKGKTAENKADSGANGFRRGNPYADSIFPDMKNVNYSGSNLPRLDKDGDDKDDKYSLSSSGDIPTQTKKVDEKDMNANKGKGEENELLAAENFLNNIDMQEIIAASKDNVEVSEESQEEIDKAKLRYNIIVKRIFNENIEINELSGKLKKLDTNAIYKAIVRYKSLSQKQRKVEHSITKIEHKTSSSGGSSPLLGLAAVLSLLLGLSCFFIDQIISFFPEIAVLGKIYDIIMELPLNNIIAGNVLSGGAFVLISILLIIALVLGNETGDEYANQITVDEVALDDLKNNIRMAKREVVDALGGFPIPPVYLDNPNNTITSIISELREADDTYNNLLFESTMPDNENYRALWKLSKNILDPEEIREDLFDNIAKMRLKIQDYKADKEEQDRKMKETKMRISMVASKSPGLFSSQSNDDQFSQFNGASGFAKPKKESLGHTDSGSIGLPSQQDSSIRMPASKSESKSESNSFKLPETKTSDMEHISTPEEHAPESSTFGTSQPSGLNTAEDTGYSSDSNTFDSSSENTFSGSGMSEGMKDTGYPSDGGMYGAAKGDDYSQKNNFGSAKNTDYLSDNETQGSAESTSQPSANNMPESKPDDTGYSSQDIPVQVKPKDTAAADSDFGIPGIRRYSGTAPTPQKDDAPSQSNQPETNKYTDNIKAEPAADDNPYGIPGIRKYTNTSPAQPVQPQQPAQPPQSTQRTNPYDIPGIHKYTDTEHDNHRQTAPNNPYDIPGVKKYTDEQPHSAEPTKEAPSNEIFGAALQNDKDIEHKMEDILSKLPGRNKFSNFGDQLPAKQEAETIVPVIPPAVTPPVASVSAAAATGELAGLDKFSNRKEQPLQPPTQEADNQQEQPTPETAVQDPFSIPGIRRYTEKQQDIAAENIEKQEIPEVQEIEKPETVEENIQEATEPEPPVKDEREEEYEQLLELLGDHPEEAIQEVENITKRLQKEVTKRDTAMASLLNFNDAAVRLSTLSSNKWPYKQKAIDASQERIDYLEADKLKLTRHIDMLEGKMEQIEYEDTPQAISDSLSAIEAEVKQLKLENDKHAIAEELIEKQRMLDLSSSSDRSHVIDDTSEYMKELTLGKYVQVKINDDLSGLSICNKDGQWFDTTRDRLSQATREQLYLALRISIADLFDEKSLIFPMFFDEALITWDKRRMKAVMRLLSKMSMHRQVIIFTCHDWLRDMISDYLIGAKIIMM